MHDTTPFTFNLYQYAYANPLRYTDADGLFNSPETLSKQRMMMHMTDEEREQFIDNDNQIMLGMSWDTGKDLVIGTVMMIPGTLRLIVEAGQKQIADATRFAQDALAWDITTAWHNRLQAEHDRKQQLVHAVRTGFREYGQRLATNPRTVGQAIGGTLLLADGLFKTGIRFAERRALRKLAAERVTSQLERTVEPNSVIRNPWNQYQRATRGRFSSRSEAATAYRDFMRKGIVEQYKNPVPLNYDITRWAEYGLPSDGYFVRTLTPRQYRALISGRFFEFGGSPQKGFPKGMGFIGAAEEVRHVNTVEGYREALRLNYDPMYIMEFQLRDYTGLQNVMEAPFEEFVYGGKTGAGFSEWNYPGLNSNDIINPRVRVLRWCRANVNR